MLSKYLLMCVWEYLATAISTGDLRVNDGHDNGRLEIYINGQWGTVCDDKFDDIDATVACKQLKFGAGFSLRNNVQEGTGPIWLDSVNCRGHESKLLECSHDDFESSDCTHYEDVGVRCFYRVIGGWSVWSPWSDCSVTCGLQYRHRKCDNPIPNHGGRYCSGSVAEKRNCSFNDCTKVNGGWSAWLSWGSCGSSCGIGIRYRFRWCSNPVPEFGGTYCTGLPFSHQICNHNECQGKYSDPAEREFKCCPPYVLVVCILSTIICIAILSFVRRKFCTLYKKDEQPPAVYDDLQLQSLQQQQRHTYDNVKYTTEEDSTSVYTSDITNDDEVDNRHADYVNVNT